MDRILITGGKRLTGELQTAGAKNAVLPILASVLLSPGPHRVTRVPQVRDVQTICELLGRLGVRIQKSGSEILLTADTITESEAPYELVKTMRASVLVLGPLVARFGEARVSLPGGCAIGARPINLHLMGLEKMGAEVRIEHGYVQAKATKLRGAHIALTQSTVTGTENLMMAATLAEGATVIENAACEPEVMDLADFLNRRGARVRGAGTPRVMVEGVSELRPADHSVMPDRIEAATYLAAAAITGGDVMVRGAVPEHLKAVTEKLRQTGCRITETLEGIRLQMPDRSSGRLRSVDITTQPYPGFPTDMQAQMMALMSVADGLSVITETVFENRFTHVAELQRMGAQISIEGGHAIVRGVRPLSGAPVMASDLRASAGLVLAGLAAEGETRISRVYHLDRGYERLEEKLAGLGARIRREKE
jgi:UDP-N-acetylglucosamine 1-carboxyvinyltransferase